ncbi:hypothetical protein PSTG_12449 [Puccinia striiformis f. sp. tritici PST-78]|uniref:Uncharacterized protein n=1 Tax=Puccinia striiformis f. sp. tritici PST-78 TaxID=1165861 RepID=A0A0L0V4U3_9BASI|nr:hypothetical protein PSTG_12449 [Puccinia striiformis f. sp. tritici PST-78]
MAFRSHQRTPGNPLHQFQLPRSFKPLAGRPEQAPQAFRISWQAGIVYWLIWIAEQAMIVSEDSQRAGTQSQLAMGFRPLGMLPEGPQRAGVLGKLDLLAKDPLQDVFFNCRGGSPWADD